jgi:hypothetical protein
MKPAISILELALAIVVVITVVLTVGLWIFGDSKDHGEVVQIEMHPHPPQPRPGPYEFEFKRAEEIWDRDHIVYVPSRRHIRRSHKLTHEAENACYDRDGKQITPIPRGCTDMFIERDK